MPANEQGRGPNTRRTQPFIYQRPRDQSAPPVLPQTHQTSNHSPVFPTLATPVPTPVLQPFIPLRIESDSSSGTLELSGTVHQPFLLEVLFLSPGIPTQNSAELQAFVNHCRFLLGQHQNRTINHSITDLHEITLAPAVFAGHLWRYRITITTEGVLEDY